MHDARLVFESVRKVADRVFYELGVVPRLAAISWICLPEGPINQCSEIGKLIREAVGSYNKTKVFRLPFKMESVEAAIGRAKAAKPQGPILEELGSEVFRIIENLVKTKSISVIEN